MNEAPRTASDTPPLPVAAADWFAPSGTGDPVSRRRGRYIGQPVSRVDGPVKVQGTARFAAEYAPEGTVYAAVAFSTIAKGRIARMDTSRAEAADGVVLVMTSANCPRLKPPPVFLVAAMGAAGDDVPVLQDDLISWNGQPVAVVLAGSQDQADHAVTLIDVDYVSEPARTDFAVARETSHEALPVLGPLSQSVGDVDAALAAALHKVDAVYSTPRHSHNAIEPHAVTVWWDGDDLHVRDASQLTSHVSWSLASIFGIEADQVHVTSPFVGGGFGGKGLWQHHVLAAAASRLSQRPVRLSLSREGVYRVVGGRAATEQRVAVATDSDGHLTALIHEGVSTCTPHAVLPEAFVIPAAGLYSSETRRLDVRVVDMDTIANTFMRAPGEAVGTFALESAMDEMAVALNIDPIEFRLRNEPAVHPSSGLPFSSRHLIEAYRSGAERFGWYQTRARPGQRREDGCFVGTGVATATYPYQRMPGAAARIRLGRGGRTIVEVNAHEMGMGTATVHAQITAERLAVPADAVSVFYGDSSLPGVVMAAGSQQTAAVGAAVIAAHRQLVVELLRCVPDDSPLTGLAVDDVGVRDGGLCRLDDPACWTSYDSLLDHAMTDEVSALADAPPSSETQTWAMHSYGAVFSEVLVDAVTGELRVRRMLGSYDCGRILNPKTAASQVRGGMIMGIGMALMEQTEIDPRNGRVMNPSLAEYHVPSHLDVPDIEVIWTDLPDPHTPMGAHGVGEIGITGVAASIANAVYDATGRRVRVLPITLDKVL